MSKDNPNTEKEIKIKCSFCEGKGIYKGFTERNCCAVICSYCQGKGWSIFRYKEFTGLKIVPGIERIFKGSYGYIHSDQDYMSTEDNQKIEFSKGGCTYTEWLNGVEPKPVKDLYCPYIWNNRGIGNEPCSRCKDGNKGFGRISDCKYFDDKAKCWEEYESEE